MKYTVCSIKKYLVITKIISSNEHPPKSPPKKIRKKREKTPPKPKQTKTKNLHLYKCPLFICRVISQCKVWFLVSTYQSNPEMSDSSKLKKEFKREKITRC